MTRATRDASPDSPRVAIVGAGIAGLTAAQAFVTAGCHVTVFERQSQVGQGCSYYAGGMIAPWCEAEASDPLIVALGREGLDYWTSEVPLAVRQGSLLVAAARDLPELTRFGRRTSQFETIDGPAIAALEPDLAGRFNRALYFPEEVHLDPRHAMDVLFQRLSASGRAEFRFGVNAPEGDLEGFDWTIDCRGHGAQPALADLRGVKGEMLVVETHDIHFSRPVQMLHPRHPVYIVPRAAGRFMIGATAIENEERGRVRARAVLDLLGAAYTVHPAFGEAEIVEMGCDLRPAFADNNPRLRLDGRRLHINGFYRHGFLVAPALARRAARMLLQGEICPEVTDAHSGQRQTA